MGTAHFIAAVKFDILFYSINKMLNFELKSKYILLALQLKLAEMLQRDRFLC